MAVSFFRFWAKGSRSGELWGQKSRVGTRFEGLEKLLVDRIPIAFKVVRVACWGDCECNSALKRLLAWELEVDLIPEMNWELESLASGFGGHLTSFLRHPGAQRLGSYPCWKIEVRLAGRRSWWLGTEIEPDPGMCAGSEGRSRPSSLPAGLDPQRRRISAPHSFLNRRGCDAPDGPSSTLITTNDRPTWIPRVNHPEQCPQNCPRLLMSYSLPSQHPRKNRAPVSCYSASWLTPEPLPAPSSAGADENTKEPVKFPDTTAILRIVWRL